MTIVYTFDDEDFEYEIKYSEEKQIEHIIKEKLINKAKSLGFNTEKEIVNFLISEYEVEFENFKEVDCNGIFSEVVYKSIEDDCFKDLIYNFCYDSALKEYKRTKRSNL